MVTRQQQLLDELDEARIVAKTCRRGWWLATLVGLMSLLMVLSGAVVGMWSTAAKVDFGWQATLLVILGVFGLVGSVVFGCYWHEANTTDYTNSRDGKTVPPPAARLRAAERAYRNHVMEE